MPWRVWSNRNKPSTGSLEVMDTGLGFRRMWVHCVFQMLWTYGQVAEVGSVALGLLTWQVSGVWVMWVH